MKLVIDIPDKDYEFIKDLQSLIIGSRGNCRTIQKNVINAIKNGTPYEERPKGKWIGDTDYESCQGNYEAYKCSECGYGIDWRKHHQLMCQDKIPEEYREYYCSHCGADMRGEEK